MAIIEATAVVSSIKAAFDIAKGVQSLQTSTEVKQAVAEMLDKLVTARMQAMEAAQTEEALLKEVSDLKAEVERLKAWDGEKQRYQLKRFHPGSFAYVMKPEMAAGDPPHSICAHCYQQTKKSLLQDTGRRYNRYRTHHCASCRNEVNLGQEMPDGIAAGGPTEGPIASPVPYDRFRELDD